MTKRKRDVFTVIESINNWFEASENRTTSTADPEGDSSGSEHINNPGANTTVNDWAAASPETVSDAGPWEEAGHMASGNTKLEVRPEVAEGAATYTADGSRVSKGIGWGTKEEEGSTGTSGPGSSGEDTRSIPTPGTEVAGEVDLALTAFWDVLKAAGYDVW